MLGLKLRGPFRYDGLRGHCRLLEDVRRDAEQAGRDWLSRRSRQSAMGGEKVPRLLPTDALPTPKIVHAIGPVLPGRTVMRPSRAQTLATEEPDA
jgi:hypothetical protein